MNIQSKLIALTTVTLITLAPVTAIAGTVSVSDSVFSWPTNYKSESVSEAISTFDGKIKNLEIKKPKSDQTKKTKRK